MNIFVFLFAIGFVTSIESASAGLIPAASVQGGASAAVIDTFQCWSNTPNGTVCNTGVVTDSAQISKQGWAMVDMQSQTARKSGIYTYGKPYVNVNMDYSAPTQAIASLGVAGGSHLLIDATGSAINGAVSTDAWITYFYVLEKTVLDAPDYFIPVNISGKGSLSSSTRTSVWGAAASERYPSEAWAYLGYRAPGADSEERLLYYDIGDTTKEFTYSFTRSLLPGAMGRVRMRAGGKIGRIAPPYDYAFSSGEFQAIIDPVIEIDPLLMVDYNGTMVSASSLYSMEFSEGILPQQTNPEPEPIPAPPSIALFVFGFVGLMAMHRKSNTTAQSV